MKKSLYFKIVFFMAIVVITTGCEKLDDSQIKIKITDIPAEYDGQKVQSYLRVETSDYSLADSYTEIITKGAFTTEMYKVAPPGHDYIQPVPFTDNGKYIISFHIFGDRLDGVPGTLFYWSGNSALVNINKGTTTLSFNDFKISDNLTYPFAWDRYEESSFDKMSIGRYKGVIAGVGLSGTVDMEVYNNSNTAKARIVIGGRTDELTCTSPLTFQQVYMQSIVNITFKGAFSSFTFSVDGEGRNPIIGNFSIEGYDNVSAVVLKNKYYYPTTCYEGTYSGDCRGVFNVVRGHGDEGGSVFSMLSKGDEGITFSSGGGIYQYGDSYNPDIGFNNGNATTIFNGVNYSFDFKGRFSVDYNNLSGTWKNTWNEGTSSGSFSCKKTL